MRRLIGIAIVTSLLTTGAVGAYAEDAWSPTFPPFGGDAESLRERQNQGYHNLFMREQAQENLSTGSFRITLNQDQAHSPETWFVCNDPGPNLDCGTGKEGFYSGSAILGICSDNVESCIERVWIYQDGEQPVEAELVRTLEGNTTVGYPGKGIPSGETISIWKSLKSHSGGNGNYAVVPTIKFTAGSHGVSVDKFTVTVVPVREAYAAAAIVPEFSVCYSAGSRFGDCLNNGNFEGNVDCVYTQAGICANAQRFSDGTRIGIELRLHNRISGWFHGRVTTPTLSVSKVSAKYNKVKIDALPVKVSRFFAQTRPDIGDPILQNLVGDLFGYGGQQTIVESTQPGALSVLEGFRARANDTAAGTSTIWSISSMSANDVSYTGSSCLSDTSRLLGLVTTNATAYSGQAPRFKKGSLDYSVGGLHYLPGGEELARGTYDLVMRSDVARCLYGFPKVPISAKVSVIGSQGEKTAATTLVSQKNGWLRLAAYGFTFSNKTIKVKIKKAAKLK